MDRQITDLLERLAAQMGVAVEYLWPVLVRYTFAQAVTTVVLSTVLLIAVVALYGWFCKILWGRYTQAQATASERRGYPVEFFDYGMGLGVGGAIAVVLCSIAVIFLGSAIPGVIAPEGATIMGIVRGLK